MQDFFAEGTLFVDVDGQKSGQVNGLAVTNLGGFSFGFPARITAQTFLGHYGVINIEREARLAGKIQHKSVLILSGFLRGLFAKDMPLSLAATLAFEQNYGLVEGDSATVAELAALVSAITDTPIRQDLAITGSMNQQGEVQPVGGINEKIEGFFDICQKKGWTGSQGVIIPKANLVNLMLKDEVIQAVAAKTFHIYAVSRVEEAFELLTDVPFGLPKADGTFDENTLAFRLKQRFQEANRLLRALDTKTSGEEGQ
jgi:predicted ATP-dependent protease